MQQVNIGLDILGFLMAGVILICVLYERYLSKTKANNFVAMTISIMFVLFSDAFVYAFDKDVAHPNLIYFFNTLNFVSAYLSLFFFMRYLREWIFDYSGNFKKIMIFFEILFVLQVGVVFANLFTDIIFYVDPVYGYTRGKLFILSQIYPIVVFVVSVACIYSFKGLSKVGRAFFALFPVFPLIGLFLDYIIGDMSISYLGLLFSLMMLFGYVYMNKTHQIGEQKNSLITSQIKPHFMYNTLTSIASLCDVDPQKAKEVTISFSSYLRKNLDSISVKGPISFASELEHVNAYLVIEKTRFGDRVNYEFDIKAYDFRLPALTIQPLVENAVKHGICQKKKGGTVKISSFENKNYYVIVIEDDGVGFDFSEEKKDGKVHIGLSSVRDRLNYYCRGTLHVYSRIGEGSKITISIPKSFGGGVLIMKILACDDELLALSLLERAIQEACPDAELFVFDDVDEALECAKEVKIDVAFLDIQMPGMTGLELAKALKDINGKINIIFATGYDEFMKDGLELRMSGYIFKPVTPKAIKDELDNLRNPVVWDTEKVRVQTFGNFAVYVENMPIKFDRKQAKEILAYLIDKRGTGVTFKELAAVLYEDDEYDRTMQKNIQVYVASLIKTLEKNGVKHIVNKNRKEIMVNTKHIDCDYYRFLNREVAAINSYTGQYMNEYSWAEFTASFLDRKIS